MIIGSRQLATGRAIRCATVLAAAVMLAQPLSLLAGPSTTRLQPRPHGHRATSRHNVPAAAPVEEGLPNFDIRYSKVADTDEAFKGADPSTIAELQSTVAEARNALAADVPGLRVSYHDVLQTAQIVDVATSSDYTLAKNSGVSHEATVRQFINGNSGLYGLSRRQAERLEVSADYTNPAGNLSWVEMRQTVGGIPVFRGTIRAALTSEGDLARTVSEVVPALDYNSLAAKPRLSAAEAVASAAASIGVTVDPASLVVKTATNDGRGVVFDRGPFDGDIKVDLQYFPLKPGDAPLAWSMVLWRDVPAYYVFIDASTGRLLYRKNITNSQSQTATYGVYNDDSPGPFSPSAALPGSGMQGAGISRTQVTVVSELPAFDDLGWITDGGNTTTGNNVDAGLDIASPNGIDAAGRPTGSPSRVFDFSYSPPPLGSDVPTSANYRFGAVTNLFFWANRFHDRLYSYGFTEAAGNFQGNNFGRGGLGNDYVQAEAQDYSGTDNANFATPPDGQLPRCQMYIFTSPTPDRDGDLDADIFIHEFAHGLSNRLHGNAGGLNFNQGGGMGEGWSDFYARCLLSTAGENIGGNFPAGGYATLQLGSLGTDNYYYGIRRFPYALRSSLGSNSKPFSPLTFADVDSAQMNTTDGAFPESPLGFSGNGASEVHNVGEIWCLALLEVRARIIGQLGFAAGNDRMLQITTDGMKLDPSDPTMLNARDSILTADIISFAGADERQIWEGFASRGMGVGATVAAASASTITVTESFATPNIALGGVTVSDAQCNNNGFPEPGETVTLTVPLTNQYAVTPATSVSATLVGGATVNYGTISGGQTIAMPFDYSIPPGTPCGSTITLTFDVSSSLGNVQRTYVLQIGQPGAPTVVISENFDGVAAPNLPVGWTTSASGSLPRPWVTRSDTSVSAPNSAAVGTPYPTNTSDDALVSPAFAVPGGTVSLTFTHRYSFETPAYDGGRIEIKIGAGSFTDIITAGGSFIVGGYNGTISSCCSNPIGGGMGFVGASSGPYTTTTVNLPAAAAGQMVQLRWRAGYDTSAAGGDPSWAIDNVSVSAPTFSCAPAGCGGGNQPPVAAAGNDQTVNACTPVTLDGTASSDPDSGPQPLSYSWTQTAGPTVALAGATTAAPTFGSPNVAMQEVLTFQLTVSDGLAQNSDSVSVTVNHVSGVNVDTAGLLTTGASAYFLRNCNAPGPADLAFVFGVNGYVPLSGDYDGDGEDTVGAYDPATSCFFLRNSNSAGPADLIVCFGVPGQVPLVGDWDGNGSVTVGVYDPATGTFFLRNSNTSGPADLAFGYGAAGATPLVGDWDGDGTTTVGIYLPAFGVFFLRNSNSPGTADLAFTFGAGGAGVLPLVGNWDGIGGDTVGIYVQATGVFFLKNSNSNGAADIAYQFGIGGIYTPITGNWDGF